MRQDARASGAQQRFFDVVAIGASALCLLHCLALPAAILLLPALAVFLQVPESFHLAALAVAVPTSAVALGAGYRTHETAQAIGVALPGIALLAWGALMAQGVAAETGSTVAGALLLALAHVLNWRALALVPGAAT
ncbi:MerC mercury resistance protein [Sphingomonas guangdongensis]|uniref:MerC mercury resistance protein n=1 Tax=Sphingomonas guangdongensis TaxID=1141890 RepID=A0A285QZC5_9SPHN|nr:MerC family mercury resistance protein [Sphingomonas guangdongensis]SOB87275.1 MerC mercury resistance protein [Sphingomonas guangdongensis]